MQGQQNWMISAMTPKCNALNRQYTVLWYCISELHNSSIAEMQLTCCAAWNWHFCACLIHPHPPLFCPKMLFTQSCANFLCILIVCGARILWAHLSQMFCSRFLSFQKSDQISPYLHCMHLLQMTICNKIFLQHQCCVQCSFMPKQQHCSVEKVTKSSLLPNWPRRRVNQQSRLKKTWMGQCTKNFWGGRERQKDEIWKIQT